MCFYKRIIWGCGCPRGTILDRPCQYRGTSQCQIRHLLERIRVSRPCRVHQALGTSSRRSGPRRRTQRSGGLILRRYTHASSGSGSASGSTASGSTDNSPIRAATNGIANGLNGTARTPPNRGAPTTPARQTSTNNITNTNTTHHGNGINGTNGTPNTPTAANTPNAANTPTTASTSTSSASASASSPMIHSADNSPLAAMAANRRAGAARGGGANLRVNGNPNPRATAYFNSIANDSGSESE